MSESYLVIKDRYLGISVTLRSGSRYEISMVEAAGTFATDALVGAVKRGVVGGGAKADLLDILLLGQFRETAV